ncbi:putative MFS family arabinose efflux permease [Bogoriella caseilytica]|uniref:Putative MFS family arabinose efflux permease n=1 Tax=Bogoriella caseilytica TaxID=56055 RepID=A0A3N2BDL6_9MICO|nr:MFS transporter [Bogoriella caseilytica]ROR73332.1 putative MFS family arabinose efflux permease [Bogoriella caseilytica]
MSRTFYSLRFFNYRLWFGGALVANIGTWMQRIAQDWLVLTVLTAGSATAVGVTTGLQFLPILLLSPYAGLLADRLPRRALLMTTQGGMGLLALALGLLVLSGHAELWHVYCFALGLGVFSALDAPARQTFVAEMVPREHLPNAVGLNSTSFNIARLLGPATAGFMIAAVGEGWVFLINAITFAGTILALAFMRKGELQPLPHAKRGKGQVRAGIAYVRGRSDILTILLVVGVIGAFGLNFQLTSAVMASETFGLGAGEYGILGSVLAIGSLSGALMAARRRQPRLRVVVAAAAVFGLVMILQSVAPTYWIYVALCAPVGFLSLTMLTSANAAVQLSTEPTMRGRVMSLYMMVVMGTTPIGAPLVGWIAEAFGPRWAVAVGGVASLVVALAAGLWVKRRHHMHIRYSLHRPYVMVIEDSSGERAATQPSTKPAVSSQESTATVGTPKPTTG